jgi:hypothetical protein
MRREPRSGYPQPIPLEPDRKRRRFFLRWRNIKLFRRRSCLVPTFYGCIVLLLLLMLVVRLLLPTMHSFLAVNDREPAKILVVEGWAPDFALEAAAAEFKEHGYDRIYVTGGPLEQGSYLSQYKDFATLGAKSLGKIMGGTNSVEGVAAPEVAKDRTFASAMALKERLSAKGPLPADINLLSVGAHARRSRLLFQKAFGRDVKIGVIAVPNQDYDPSRWWRTSSGVRTVISELVAYGYARFLFRASKPS